MSARRLVVFLFVMVGMLVFVCAPAFAAAPETPEAGSASAIAANTATLEGGVLNPKAAGEPGEYEYLYKASATECEGGSVAPVPEGLAAGIEKEIVPPVKLSGLKAAQAYTFCLVERNAVNPGEVSPASAPVTFTTLDAQPAIESEYASFVEASGATLNAQIDPDGEATTYHFQYGTSEAYGENTAETALPENGKANVRIPTVGKPSLKPDTTYHYRVVAVNSLSPTGGTPGPDKTFTTPATLGSEPAQNCPNEQRRAEQPYALALPDCRAYEMVSPLETNGQDATDSFINPYARASVSGEAVTYASAGAFANPTGLTEDDQLISRRGPEGWTTQSVTPIHDPEKGETSPSYQTDDFTPELTEGVAETNAALTSGAPPGGINLELYLDNFASGAYQYLGLGLNVSGSSADLSHVIVGEEGTLAEWVDGRLLPIGVANDGESMEASVGSEHYYKENEHKNAWQAVSADGSRVYFTSPAWITTGPENNPIPGALYLRENIEQPQSPMSGEECIDPNDACTIDVSASQRSVADLHGPQQDQYWGASANGSKVFFTSKAELTEDAYTGPADNAANLYRYDLEGPVGERLKDLTVDKTDANGAAVLGVAQIAEEGSYVYFVAEGALAGKAIAGEPNLYVSREGAAPEFIATLAAGDKSDWYAGGNVGESGPEINTAVVTPSGNRLAFVSEDSLTGYDNEQAEPGECESTLDFGTPSKETGRCREIFFYNAETGKLACASCDPTGARPVGPSSLTARTEYLRALYRVHNLTEGGALFFDSADALIPHASDGRLNVYEYENGHVYPISDVAGGYESFFLDASPNGKNVFFASADQLLAQDTSNNVVVYDARVGGGFPVTVSRSPCTNGDSCKPPPAPQLAVFGAPGSATFSGPGNIAPVPVVKSVVKGKAKSVGCKKGNEKKKGKCVKKKRKPSKKGGKSSDRKGSK